MTLALAVAAVILAALVLYTLTGGADFGGGVWDLLASGPRRDRQRHLIAHAIAPIWEANHVWLIVVVVLLFVCFPDAFAAVSTALHIPLLLMLIGIVLRGTAFTFRAYGEATADEEARWGRLFAISSIFTPVMLGICLGAVASGRIRVDDAGRVSNDFVSAWWAPFPVAVGFFVLVLFAFLAAVYLAVEADDRDLANDFRLRAIVSGILLGPCALAVWWLARSGAPAIHHGLVAARWAVPLQLVTAVLAIGALGSLALHRLRRARIFAAGQAVFIVLGLGVSLHPFIVVPDLTIAGTAAPDSVLGPTLIILAVGALLLIPAFVVLYRLFSRQRGARSD